MYLAAVTDEALRRARADAGDHRARRLRRQARRRTSAPRSSRPRGRRTARSPRRPRARSSYAATIAVRARRGRARATPDAMMRALCVLASYEPLQRSGRAVAAGDLRAAAGARARHDRRTTRCPTSTPTATAIRTPGARSIWCRAASSCCRRSRISSRAMQRCTGTICTSDDREFRFGFKPVGGELLAVAARDRRAAAVPPAKPKSRTIPCCCCRAVDLVAAAVAR